MICCVSRLGSHDEQELFDRLVAKGAYSEADCARHVRDMAYAVQFLHSYVIHLVNIKVLGLTMDAM